MQENWRRGWGAAMHALVAIRKGIRTEGMRNFRSIGAAIVGPVILDVEVAFSQVAALEYFG